MKMQWNAMGCAALWLGLACLSARGQGSLNEVAMRVLRAPEEAARLDAPWALDYADLAEACDQLAPFEPAGPQTLEFQPAAPAHVSVMARRGGGAPDHWIFINGGPASYSGRVRLSSGGKGAAVYTILWATPGVKCGAQSAKAGETMLDISLPSQSAAALRPLATLGGGKNFQTDITRAEDVGGTITLEFKMDAAAASALKKIGATLYIPARSQMLHAHANGRGGLSFAPMEGVDKIRPVPFEVGKLAAANLVTLEYRPPLWANLN
ncbi:MAG: hypothetical protein NTX50_24535, partial [Candidatus Sumerlaeota bacterium]|nr:hypothetical protein [Candidatus Sumerlaeota bacterium]